MKTTSSQISAWIDRVEANLAQLGRQLPDPPAPLGAYRAVVVRNGVGAVSGQFPFQAGDLAFSGRIGLELDEEEGKEAARLCTLNLIAVLVRWANESQQLPGLLRMDGYVASAPDWTRQAVVLDAASEMLLHALGLTLGEHARAAFSVPRLPLDAPVELCATFAAV